VERIKLYNQKVNKLIKDLKDLLTLSKSRDEKAIEFIQVSTPHFNNRPLHSFSKKYKSENNFGVCAFNDFYSSSFSRVSNTGTLHSGTSLFDSFSNPKPIWSDLEIEITSFDYDCTKSISMLEKSVGLNLDIHSDYISDLSEFEWKIAKIENSLKNQILYIQRQLSLYSTLNLLCALKRKAVKKKRTNLRIPTIISKLLYSISNASRLKFLRLNIIQSNYLLIKNFNNERYRKIRFRFL